VPIIGGVLEEFASRDLSGGLKTAFFGTFTCRGVPVETQSFPIERITLSHAPTTPTNGPRCKEHRLSGHRRKARRDQEKNNEVSCTTKWNSVVHGDDYLQVTIQQYSEQ
jgi:hypothetical protein